MLKPHHPPPTTASALESHQQLIGLHTSQRAERLHGSLSTEDRQYLEELQRTLPYFKEINGKYILSVSTGELQQQTGVSSTTLNKITQLLETMNATKHFYVNKTKFDLYKSRVEVKDWKIYFTHDEVGGLLLSAAQAGAPAMTAALTALGSVYPGVGNIVGLIVGLYGAGTIIYWVTQAATLHQGLYIGVDWNGLFPNPAIGTW